MSQVVTELIVDGSGALRVLDQYERGMDNAARSTQQTTGAVSDFATAMGKFTAAQEKGLAITTLKVERISKEQKAWDGWRSSIDKATGLEIKLRREAQQAAVAAANVVALGYVKQEDALRELIALEAKHAAQLADVRNVGRTAVAATNEVTQATKRLAVANDNAQFSTANLAAQFQDIAVTSAMGMSPLQIALQQGTQISAVLGPMGAAGAVRSLGAAFLSIVNPVSLVTIGLVAAAAAALQYFMSSKDDAKRTNELLKQHGEIIAALRESYGQAAAGLDDYTRKSRAVLKAEALIAGDKLKAELKAATDALIESGDVLANAQEELRQREADMLMGIDATRLAEIMPAFEANRKAMEEIGDEALVTAKKFAPFTAAIDDFAESARKGSPDYIALREAVSRGINAEPANKELRDLGAEILTITERGAQVQAAMRQAEAGINLVGSSSGGAARNVMQLSGALQALGAMVPNLARAQAAQSEIKKANDAFRAGLEDINRHLSSGRSRFEEAAADALGPLKRLHEEAIRNVTGLAAAEEEQARRSREAVIAGMQPREAALARIKDQYEENAKAIRRLSETGVSQAKVDELLAKNTETLQIELQNAAKGFDDLSTKAFPGLLKSANDRIEQMRLEIDLIGKSGIEAERYRMELDLIQQATDKGRKPTEDQIRQLKELAAQYAEVAAAMSAARAIDQLEFDRQQMFRSETEQAVYAQLRQIGLDINSIDGRRVADAIRINKGLEEQRDTAREIASIFSDMFSGPIKDADAFFDKLTSGFARIAQANIDKFFDNLFTGGAVSGVGAAKTATTKSSFLDQIGGWLDGILSNRKVIAAQNKAITTAASQIPAKPLVSAMATVGSSVSKITSSIGSSVEALMEAIKSVESGGNYRAMGPVTRNGDRAYGAYQVMGNNIPSWTKELLGYSVSTQQFLRDNALQDRVAFQQMSKSFEKFSGSWQDVASVWFSGQPLAKARMRSDGYNSTQQYVDKVGNVLGNPSIIQDAVKVGAKTGVETGITSVANTNTGNSVSPPGLAQGGLSGLGGMLGNALSGFSLGFQSENGAMGGLGGAISGFMSGGLPGAIIGGIAGLIGGIFGRSRRKRQEKEQARAELESQRGAIQSLIDAAMGTPSGEFESSWRQMSDEIAKARKLASKAGDSALVKELDLASETFFNFLVDDWRRGLDGVMKAMESGHGMEGAFVRAQKAISDLSDTLVGFVEDAKWFAETGGDYEKAKLTKKVDDNTFTGIPPDWYTEMQREQGVISDAYRVAVERYKGELEKLGINAILKTGTGRDEREIAAFATVEELMKKMESLGIAFDDLGNVLTADQVKERADREKELQRAIKEAQEAAQQMALRQLTGAEEFTAIETEIQRLEGTAAGLQSTLEKLGMTAEEAADAIAKGLTEALEKLRDDYVKDLTRSINELSGAGYINDVMDAMKLYEERLKDSKALGIDTSLAFTELTLSLREISREAGLSGEDLKYLAKLFPDIAKILNGIAPTGGLADAQAAVDRAKADLRAAYDEEARAIESTISRLKSFITSIEKFKASLRLDDQLSPLSPFDKFLEAQKRFEEVSQKARAGDETAMNDLEDVSRQYLEEARAYYASSEQYFAIFEQVEAILDQALASAKGQLSTSEQQLVTLKEQVSKLIDIDNSVMTVAAAIAALQSAIEKLDGLGGSGDTFDPSKHWSSSLKDFYAQLQAYKAATKTDVVPSQLAGVWNAFGSAKSGAEYDLLARAYADILRGLMPKAGMRFGGIVGAYSDGGIVGNGIYDRDSVLARYAGGGNIALAGGEQIIRATSVTATTRPFLDHVNRTGTVPSNDNSAVAAELRALRAEVAALRAERKEGDRVVAAGAQHVANAVEDGTRATEDIGRKVGQQSLRRQA